MDSAWRGQARRRGPLERMGGSGFRMRSKQCCRYTPKSNTRNTFPVQNALRLCFLVFDFGVYVSTRELCDVRYRPIADKGVGCVVHGMMPGTDAGYVDERMPGTEMGYACIRWDTVWFQDRACGAFGGMISGTEMGYAVHYMG
eukprot:1741415-Rhodomonas_salina.3